MGLRNRVDAQKPLGYIRKSTTDITLTPQERNRRELENIHHFLDFAEMCEMEVEVLDRPVEETSDEGDFVMLEPCQLLDEESGIVFEFERGDTIDVKGHWVNPTQHNTEHYMDVLLFMDRWKYGQIGIVTREECLRKGKRGALRFESHRRMFYLLDKFYYNLNVPEEEEEE